MIHWTLGHTSACLNNCPELKYSVNVKCNSQCPEIKWVNQQMGKNKSINSSLLTVLEDTSV